MIFRFPIPPVAILAIAPSLDAGVAVREPRRICRTSCGLEAEVNNCLGLVESQARTFIAVRRQAPKEWTISQMCKAVRGWKVVVHERTLADNLLCTGGGWLIPGTTHCIAGRTYYGANVIEVQDFDYVRGRLAHELIHVFQGVGQPYHCFWKDRGLQAAIMEASGASDAGDPKEPEVACKWVKR